MRRALNYFIRKASERGMVEHGWLKAAYSFSFGNYYDPRFMGYRSLRVINEDRIAGGKGFSTHSHNDMEILTLVQSGVLEHKDSLGNGSLIRPGEAQLMSAGTGIAHSEFNYLKDEQTHLFQIWILPNKRGLKPTYQQFNFLKSSESHEQIVIASPDQRNASLLIQQDAIVYYSELKKNQKTSFKTSSDRGLWLQMLNGRALVQSQYHIEGSDALAIEGLEDLEVLSQSDNEAARYIVFDLA